MLSWPILSSLPVTLAIFAISLMIVIFSATRFTKKLEELCSTLNLSIGLLSLLSAIGANIPNYVSSTLAIFAGHTDVGIGIIIGSTIYDIAIILGLCTFFSPERNGITLNNREKRDVRVIASFAIAVASFLALVIFCLPGAPLSIHLTNPGLLLSTLGVLGIFSTFLFHRFKHSHERTILTTHHHGYPKPKTLWFILRLISEILLTLLIALGGVLVMVQSGEKLTTDLHMPSVLAGLLVLAVATSLPNTVVAISLVRTGEAAACIEEIGSSGITNISLGLALPLAFWPSLLSDNLLLFLDTPFMLALVIGLFFWILTGRISRAEGFLLLAVYAGWVLLHFWL